MPFSPPGRDLDQSDIFKSIYFYSIDKCYPAVLVTPICDIKQDKADYLSFCGIILFSDLVVKILRGNEEIINILKECETKAQLSTKKREKLEKFIGNFKSNFHYPRYHWLNTFPNENELRLVDFQFSTSLTLEEAKSLERILSIRSPYREQIPVRYSTYMARIGVPNLSAVEEHRIMDISIDTLFSVRDKIIAIQV